MTHKNEDSRTWFNAWVLPTPGIPLRVRLENGTETDGIRPRYIASYDSEPEYRTPDGQLLSGVVQWAHR